MLASISPVGEAARRQRWSITVSAYLLASALGGVLIGGLLGTLGAAAGTASLSRSWALGTIGLATIGGAAIDAGWLPVRLPSWRRQVDERWLTTYRGWVYGSGYGLQLGAAMMTIVTSAITYAALLAALLVGSSRGGATIGVTFGIVRALPLLSTARLRSPQRLRRFHARVETAARPAELMTIAVQVIVATVAVTLAVGSST